MARVGATAGPHAGATTFSSSRRCSAGGDVAQLASVELATCTSLRAISDAARPIQADGDIVGSLPATLTLCEEPLIFC